MENPYRWPEALRAEWLERLRDLPINRYPDPAATELARAVRNWAGLSDTTGLLFGNGSDELIQMLLLAVAGPDRKVLVPEPTFVMYRILAGLVGMECIGVDLEDDFSLDTDAFLAAMARHRPAILFLAWPNNPTGRLLPRADLLRIVEAAPGLVVVDEAYAAFASDSVLDVLGEYPQLLLLRTFSKMGLAGLRLGWLAGDPAWIREIDKTRLPYNVNLLTQASVAFALEHHQVLDRQTARIRAERDRLQAALAAVPGIRVFPSEANFLLFRVPAGSADALFEGIKAQGVLIKRLGGHRTLTDCLRVTVGTAEENDRFLTALEASLAEL